MSRCHARAWHYPGTTGSPRRVLLGLAGFLLMMDLGAAGAALVFSDRLAVLLARWRSASAGRQRCCFFASDR
jgi:hypothetical protein